jgi:hypothetical protein
MAAPNTPHVGVEWNPRLRSEKLVALLTRAIISQPATTAARNSLPLDPEASAAASAADTTGGEKWYSARMSTSSSSIECEAMALANAACTAGTLPPWPIRVASDFPPFSSAKRAAMRALEVREPPTATPM